MEPNLSNENRLKPIPPRIWSYCLVGNWNSESFNENNETSNRQLKQPIYDWNLYSEACSKPTNSFRWDCILNLGTAVLAAPYNWMKTGVPKTTILERYPWYLLKKFNWASSRPGCDILARRKRKQAIKSKQHAELLSPQTTNKIPT
jgi:hypothetical protein